MIIIGLTGYKQSGKTSAAEILVKDHGFQEVRFAEPLKRMLINLDPVVGATMDPDHCDCDDCYTANNGDVIHLSDLYNWGFDDEDIKMSRYGDEVRRLWERFGTEVMRAEDPNYWVRQAANKIEAEYHKGQTRFVVSDVRFPNEAEFIYSYNRIGHAASVWNIARDEAVPEEGEPKHAAESYVGQLGEAITVVNNGSFQELDEAVTIALELTQRGGRAGTLDDLVGILSATEGTDGEE